MSVSSKFSKNVQDINKNVRRTNALLRSANAIRNTVNDIKQFQKKPTAARFFWTLIQISRTYSALRRLHNLTMISQKEAAALMGIKPPRMPTIRETMVSGIVPSLDLSSLDVKVRAYIEEDPVVIGQIDISSIPEQSRTMVQAILEEDADITVRDAKEILASRVSDDATGYLESTIYWEPSTEGTLITAGAPYAWWVERGHDNFLGHWYMQDATDRARLRLPEKIRMEINGLLSGDTLTL